jgi:pectate lyase
VFRLPFAHALATGLYGALFLLVACGTELIQTAREIPREPLDCSLEVKLALPADDVFGDGNEPPSALAAEGYEAGDGPGLFVTARDAYRVYLNGKLVVESAAARAPAFVPLSLLPGDNALSVVVAAQRGTPAALLQLDELAKSYVSDSSWRVSTEPEEGFTNAEFDDSSWSTASDYGALGSLPGCDPDQGFASDSGAHWVGPAEGAGKTAVLRKVIRIEASGYGAGTQGGGDATPVLVDTWDELQALAEDPDEPAVIVLAEGIHDFRSDPVDQEVCPGVCSEDPDKPQYRVLVGDQTCAEELITLPRTARTLDLGSNKTLVGLGRGAQLRGVSLNLGASKDVIVRNVALYDVNYQMFEAGDAFTLRGPSGVWLDHCTTKWISDGFTDITGGENITLSWMHYDGVTPAACREQDTGAAWFSDAKITVHHSFFDHVHSHSPRVDGAAHAHIYNNLFSDNLGYAVAAVCGAQVLLEGNTFERVSTPTARSACADDDTVVGVIDAPEGSNVYGDDVGNHSGGDGMEPHDEVTPPPYEYTVEDPADSWVTVLSRAGAGGPWALPLELD